MTVAATTATVPHRNPTIEKTAQYLRRMPDAITSAITSIANSVRTNQDDDDGSRKKKITRSDNNRADTATEEVSKEENLRRRSPPNNRKKQKSRRGPGSSRGKIVADYELFTSDMRRSHADRK